MEGGVKLTYQEMRTNCDSLNTQAGELERVTGEVKRLVGSFTNCWEGTAEANFEDDYNTLSSAISTTTETLREITTLVQNYVNSMEEVETAYGKSHVTVG
ncbi:MAG: WXG100 family type VII secretion target [Lachnospiraceae bacterium]|nr:WXG100 family type VII secretion target [Lachnospiraceae bacterium]